MFALTNHKSTKQHASKGVFHKGWAFFMKLSIEEWRDHSRDFYEVLPQDPRSTDTVELEVTSFGGLLLTSVTMPAQILIHDPLIQKASNHEYLLFERFFEGAGHGEVGETCFYSSTQHLHLIDMSQRYVSQKERARSRGVLIPHTAVGYSPGQDPAYVSIDMLSAEGRLLLSAHELITSMTPDASDEETAVLSGAFIDLVSRIMLRRHSQYETSEGNSVRPHDIKEFILSNLHRRDLDANLLMETFSISRSALYRKFTYQGGIERYIRDRRLDRCFFELAGKERARGRVAEVARRMNFSDSKVFNRAFRRRFDMSPVECMRAYPPEVAYSDQQYPDIELATKWLRGLT